MKNKNYKHGLLIAAALLTAVLTSCARQIIVTPRNTPAPQAQSHAIVGEAVAGAKGAYDISQSLMSAVKDMSVIDASMLEDGALLALCTDTEGLIYLARYDVYTAEALVRPLKDITNEVIFMDDYVITADRLYILSRIGAQVIEADIKTLEVVKSYDISAVTTDTEVSSMVFVPAAMRLVYIPAQGALNKVDYLDVTNGERGTLWDGSETQTRPGAVSISSPYTKMVNISVYEGEESSIFVDAASAQKLYEDHVPVLRVKQDDSPELVARYSTRSLATVGERTISLKYPQESRKLLLSRDGGVVVSVCDRVAGDAAGDDKALALISAYDTQSGELTASVLLSDIGYVYTPDVISAPSGSYSAKNGLYCIAFGDGTNPVMKLIVWDIAHSDVYAEDLSDVFGAFKEDFNELSVSEMSAMLAQRYSVEVIYGTSPYPTPVNLKVNLEQNEDKARDFMCLINDEFGRYPKGFMQRILPQDSKKGTRIYLCTHIDNLTNSLVLAGAYEFDGGEHNIFINMASTFDRYSTDGGMSIQSSLHHELAHAIELQFNTFEQDNEKRFDYNTWLSLNPEGFSYAISYDGYDERTRYIYDYETDKSNVYFVDNYSQINPGEEMARLFEYSTMPGISAQTQPEHVQAKLRYFFGRIRAAYDDGTWESVTWWERVLKEQ